MEVPEAREKGLAWAREWVFVRVPGTPGWSLGRMDAYVCGAIPMPMTAQHRRGTKAGVHSGVLSSHCYSLSIIVL